jgi:hypothetical protein
MERNDDAMRDKVEIVKSDTHDALDEAKERIEAGGEKVKRAVEGDTMPLGERVASHAKELGHEMKAEYDKSKRELRDKGN